MSRFSLLHAVASSVPLVLASSALSAQDEAMDVAALVRAARATQQWIHEVDTFYVRFEGTWTKTAEAIAARREQLRKQFPDVEKFDPADFPGLQAESTHTLSIMFGNDRARYESHQPGLYRLRVWDGSRAMTQDGGEPDEPDFYALDDAPNQFFEHFLVDLPWLRASGHSFWWHPMDADALTAAIWGPVEHFTLVGRESYDGVDCCVLDCEGGFGRWYVGVDDHLLRGMVSRVLTDDADGLSVLKKIARGRGREIASSHEYYAWWWTLPAEERREMDLEYHVALLPSSRPRVEHFLGDYEEVAPGWWFPMTQGYQFFAEQPDEQGQYVVTSRRELRAVEVRVNEPLPDELFVVDFKEGVRVNDFRYDPVIVYTYERDMPPEKLEALHAERLEQRRAMDTRNAVRDALVGKLAPPFPETDWLNSDPLTWEDLRGKVVVLDFWAEWCGPCRRELPKASDLHKRREETGITVIGVHTPGSPIAAIKEVMGEFEIQHPICIDVAIDEEHDTWGQLAMEAYAVDGIPYAFVIDRDGVIAGHGSFGRALGIAMSLPRGDTDDR